MIWGALVEVLLCKEGVYVFVVCCVDWWRGYGSVYVAVVECG